MLYLLLIILSYTLLYFYKSLAKRANIFSIENNRTLHKGKIPRGAGIVFGLLYLMSLNLFPHEIQKDLKLFYPIIIILCSSITLGFYDDLYDMGLQPKFLLQFFISLFITYIFTSPSLNLSSFILFFLFVIIVNWSLNVANFLDGIDGLLASISISISMIIIFLLNINDVSKLNNIILYFICCLSPFLFFNWSPAKIFMGDSGSLFIGSFFCILCFFITKNNFLDFWVLVIIFSYAFTETTTTLFIRIVLGQGWKKTHRSHGYQNLARILDNHSRVTIYLNLYHIVVLFPLALVAIYLKENSIYLSLISIFVSFIFVYKYGPRLSPN